MLSVTPPGREGRRLDSHQHDPPYEGGAFLCRATSAEASSEGFEPSPTELETVVLPLHHEPVFRAGGMGGVEPAASAFTEPCARRYTTCPTNQRKERESNPQGP